MSGHDGLVDRDRAAYRRGRSDGMATAAIALGALAFLNLLGAEKGTDDVDVFRVWHAGNRTHRSRRRARLVRVEE